MTIRHRIFLLIILMFTALVSIGGYAVMQSRGSARDVQRVTAGVFPSALASADLVAQLKDVQLATMVLVYAPDPNMVSEATQNLKASEASLTQGLDAQAKSAEGQAQTGLITQARESLGNYFSAINDTTKMKTAGKNELAQAYLFANVAQYRDELEGIVQTLRTEKNRQKDAAITTLNKSLATTTLTIAIVSGVAIALLTLVGIMLYRQIVGPLSGMQRMMSEIATHQDFTRRLPIQRRDEIGQSMHAFNEMIEKIQLSSSQLKQKSADIQAMLQNMQQGILTIVDGAIIHSEYSVHMESIFETSDIAGQPAMHLLFEDTNLGSDALSQVTAAIDSCLGEDAMNFMFNQHLLVNEITKRMPNGINKILDLSWSAITNEDDVIVRLMLCVRDVTELRQLAEEAGEQKRRLEMIGEILTVSQDKFESFISSSTNFINANERIIRDTPHADHDALAELFRNMHTVKGNARTYNLQHLTDVVHDAEQTYEALRQTQGAHSWDRDSLIGDLVRVREAVERYAEINDVSLGRKRENAKASNAGDVVSGEFLMVERKHIDGTLRLLAGVDSMKPEQFLAVRDMVSQMLRLIGTQNLSEVLSGVVASLPSLASQLNKSVPIVRIEDNGYRMRSEASELVQNVFVHLLRNSLDHGIEGSDERLAAKKVAAGTIDIELAVDNDLPQITLSDDGRGLALDRIRKVAIEKGLISTDAKLADIDIAHLIFRPGFSTADAVTEVSGRGVGMDAVNDFITREGGSITLRFTDSRAGEPFRQFQTIVSLPSDMVVDCLEPITQEAMQ